MISRLLLLVVLAMSPALSSAADDSNVSLVRKMVELINARDLDALQSVVAADLVRHSDATPGVTVTSLDDFREFLQTDFASVPDSVISIEQAFGADDMVAVRAVYRGTQTGQMGPFAPSGKELSLVFISILRIENDKIAEMWVEWDNLSMLGQLGHLSPPAQE